MFRIGFSKKYYTLWKVSEKIEFVQLDGVRLPYKKKTAEFIKNLSFDESTAKRKSIFEGVENYEVDFSLCGAKYLLKQYSEKSLDELFVEFCEYRSDVVKEILIQNNFVEHDGQIVYPEHGEKIKRRNLVMQEIEEKKEVRVQITSNLNYKNEFRFVIKNELFHGIFKGLSKEIYYKNAEYFLPIIGGKVRRLKGKNAIITVENYNRISGNYEINNIKFYKMKEEIIAFEELAKQLKTTTGIVKILSDTLEKSYRKRTIKNFKIEKKISDLNAEFLENLYDDGSMCGGCWKNADTCEGSWCTERTEELFNEMNKNDLRKKLLELFGDRFYSFSRRVKNELLKY